MATKEITISELELADEVLADMTLPVDTATETRAVTLKQLRDWLGFSLPTGLIIPAVGKISDARFTLLDGKILSRAETYEAFCNKVVSEVQAGNWFACSEYEYNSDISTYGQCGKFVVSNDYIRIPTITRFIGATVTLSEIGKTYKESLPNIAGTFECFGMENTGVKSTGSLYNAGIGSGKATGAVQNNVKIGFDASRSSSTYQYGAKVQPDHTKFPYYMVISTEGQTAKVQIDINKVYKDLNLKANSDLSNVASVASSFKEASIGWGIPDYSAGVKASFSSSYTAPTKGYIYLQQDNTYNDVLSIFVNGIEVWKEKSGPAYYERSCFIPVSKNDVITATGADFYTFFPCKGVN